MFSTDDLDALRALVNGLIPEHDAQRQAPDLSPGAPAALRALWEAVGESPALAPRGLTRDALVARAAEVFAEWCAFPKLREGWGPLDERGIPSARLPLESRYLSVRADRIFLAWMEGRDLS
jgi:hypothetical protein